MREINKSYFSEISKLVNQAAYNQCCVSPHDKCIYLNDICDVAQYPMIKTRLKEDGFIVIQMASNGKHNSSMIEAWLKNMFGNPYVDKNPDKSIHAKVQAEEKGRFYINSNLAQPIHTDEGYTVQYPRYGALYCYTQAQLGGVSIIVQFKALYQQLKLQFGKAVDLLFLKDAIAVQSLYGKEQKPLLIKLKTGEIGISYSPVLQNMWCTEEVFEQFNFITSYVHALQNQIRFMLQAGQVLLFDNCRILHGRTAFPKNDGRLLYRYWYGASKV